MVKGLELFREWFREYADQYVLIGGTAATLAMQSVGQGFRATKDLDVVLHLEALTDEFVGKLWDFIRAGEYAIRQSGSTGKPQLYRFIKPVDEEFPYMIELFSRAPLGIELKPDSQLAPIPAGELASSLSAILIDDAYYDFIKGNRQMLDGLPWIAEDRLIPLKALAWVDMTEAKAAGAMIDSKDVRKHLNNIVKLSGLLMPATVIEVDSRIALDLKRFVAMVQKEAASPAIDEVLRRIRLAYLL
jgi:hypothetical protein